MEYNKFVEELMKMIKEATDIENLDVNFQSDGKTLEDDRICVTLYDDREVVHLMQIRSMEAYRAYQSGEKMEVIVRDIKDDIFIYREDIIQNLRKLRVYENVENRLFIQAVSYDREGLEQQVYEVVGDIALVLFFEVWENRDNIVKVKIPLWILEKWGKEKEEVWQRAMENTARRAEPRRFRYENLIRDPEYDGDRFMEEPLEDSVYETGLGMCISTAKKVNGATVVFYPGVARRLSDLMGGHDFYIVFTSIHEVMVHRADIVPLETLCCIQKDMCENVTAKEEQLSRRIYRYCRDKDCIIQAEECV